MINKLFSPKSIAVIGASKDKTKLGHSVLANILKYKYAGKVYPINPAGVKILGLKTYKSILDIKDAVDLVVIIVPAKIVSQVLMDCGQKQVANVIIITAGFKEIGKAVFSKTDLHCFKTRR